MANIFGEVLRELSRSGTNVTLRVLYNLTFERNEIGQIYDVRIALFPHDNGANWLPKPIINWRRMPEQITANEGIVQMHHDITLPKGMLNEDKHSKDELFAFIELSPPYGKIKGKTPLLISDFK